MAIIKLNSGSGVQSIHSATTNPERAGETHTVVTTHTVNTKITTSTDILEIGLIPAGCRLVGFRINSVNIDAGNLSVGLMSGEPGSSNPTRTCGSEIINAKPANTEVAATLLDLAAIPRQERNVSIGLTHSVTLAAGATKKISVIYQIAG